MHDNRPMLLKHIDRILNEKVRPAGLETIAPLHVEAWEVTDDAGPVAGVPGAGAPVPFSVAMSSHTPYRTFTVPGDWGPAWGTTWFRVSVQIPAELRGEHLELDIDLGWASHSPGFQAEGLVRTPDGSILKAINPRNQWVPVSPTLLDDAGRLTLYIEAASNPLLLGVPPFQPTAAGSRFTQSCAPLYTFRTARLVRVHDQVRALAADVDTLLGLARTLPEDSPRMWKVLIGTSEAIDRLDPANVRAAAAEVRELLRPLLATPADHDAVTLGVIGHAHIDSAWLWPVRESRRKAVRTLANVIRLLEDGSPMIFALPAAQHAAWVKEEDPALFERLKTQVEAGRIVPVGGSWVEPDAVLPSGESLVRQLTEGTAFFRDELGAVCHEIWLPDSFGYTGALPQIAHLAGYDNFLTQKISWNQVDVFPHHTLWWEGIDGTRIFTHFPPADTYGAEASAEQIQHAQRNFKEKGRATTELFLYGYGDGGGGPVREMLDRIERSQDLAGSPRMEHMTSEEFFNRARTEYSTAPVWVGELYLEKHRGTLTSHAAIKRGNREAEAALREAETWCTTAWVRGLLAEDVYPAALLRRLWRATLLCQFHDILPGSSIAWVYEEAETALQRVIATARALATSARRALADQTPTALLSEPAPAAPRGTLPPPEHNAAPGDAPCRLVFNTAPASQFVDGVEIPPLGAALVTAADASAKAEQTDVVITRLEDGGAILTVDDAHAELDASGAVVSLSFNVDGSRQEIIPPGQRLGCLQIANDFPNEWDAWDLDPFYRASIHELPGRLVETRAENGAAQAVVEVPFGNSHARLTWTLTGDRIDLRADVSWHEKEKLLKLAFPVDVHTDSATYGAQFGHVRRPTHENTSWDAYRFEVCAHKWIQLGEPGRGVGIDNDATYGWDITRHPRKGGGTWSLVRASLLRSARFPDPNQDQGDHLFRFSVLPSAGTRQTREAAYRLDLPVWECAAPGDAVGVVPLVTATGAVIESLHPADDDSGDVLVRLYEAEGVRTRVTLRSEDLVGAVGTDLHGHPDSTLGVDIAPVTGETGAWGFELHPFGIATVRMSQKPKHAGGH
ncbi:alpha-mannosidase [Actinomyces glycerinitolerans]|uniref:Glycoside hydrolase/deacetylase beta/alpha-barrel n=1 Tax=Actinomyces glycerinitolerans TaxID=1892869 RepID=A0A1M4RYZ0_9ACTO|nr:glycoside hydrolase family 38 C-terminal domain-containing protein [Actinomyces glycerinitolerans]SHE24917.1 glycoside hydrolase/deacetylase beta/alpha-barrel [Actinomyces glycerinitolerans]